ncbi:MAG: hypothetical protein RIE08_11040 [Acidimicrobiales bacterium]
MTVSEPPAYTPRIYCIVAERRPVVAVIARGPSDWVRVGRWDVDGAHYEAGAWFHGRLFPQRSDLSPDGRWFLYTAQKPGADWAAGEIYSAISRLPWLHALAAWGAGTTYTRGARFDAHSQGTCELGQPDVGSVPLVARLGIRLHAPIQFAVERHHGWTEAPDTPPRADGGPWDEQRPVTMVRRRPGADEQLRVTGVYAAFRTGPHDPSALRYDLVTARGVTSLHEAQWADWAHDGRLLTATTDGALTLSELRGGEPEVTWRHDLGSARPDPSAPPPEARSW